MAGVVEDPSERFGFGKNWAQFIKEHFNEERLLSAQKKLLASLHKSDLKGLTFLDIGCGSGLHSYAAFMSGAESIVSFDYDPDSVRTTQYLHKIAGEPKNWVIKQGSVLDTDFVKTLPASDIVYSWGVLHHTGNMWEAIRNASLPLKKDSVFFIALYSSTTYENGALYGGPSPEKWLTLKQNYNKAGRLKKLIMELHYVLTSGYSHSLGRVLRVAKSLASAMLQARRYKESRGMDFLTDVRDWLGGWPMEFVRERDCINFAKEQLHLDCLDIVTGEGNTEFLFRPQGAHNYWDDILAKRQLKILVGPFSREEKHCWSCPIPAEFIEAGHLKGRILVQEQGVLLDYPNSAVCTIQSLGHGRYSWENNRLLFSTSDNTDPNENRYTYEAILCL